MRRGLAAGLAAAGLGTVTLLLAGCNGDDKSESAATTGKSTTTTAQPAPTKMSGGRSFVIYGKPTRAQFVDHNDDRARGDFTNPFDPDVLPTPPNANSGKKGARAGDNALFSFKLYSDRGLRRLIGSAIYNCTFNFAQEATCEANLTLVGGTMTATGPSKLDGSIILIPVTGGTGRYSGAHGQLTWTSAGNKTNTQVIRFRLV
jgi:hypothetical protein